MNTPEYRLLQVFLAQDGKVSEVSYRDSERPYFRCTTCEPDDKCKHISIVVQRLSLSDGKYPFPRVDPQKLAEAATRSPEEFREFVLTHGAVDVL